MLRDKGENPLRNYDDAPAGVTERRDQGRQSVSDASCVSILSAAISYRYTSKCDELDAKLEELRRHTAELITPVCIFVSH
jgi:hypothetical protein